MSNYIINPYFEFGQPPPPATRNAWVEIGRTTLGAPSATIDVVIPKKRWLMVLINSQGTNAGANMLLQFNGDVGNNYSNRTSINGGAEILVVNTNAVLVGGDNDQDNDWGVAYIDNNPVGEKFVQSHDIEQNTAGAGFIPARREASTKWANQVDQITTVRLTTLTAVTWNVGTEVVVLGFDPTDGLEAPSNFWQPLGGTFTNTGTAIELTGIPIRKYLWVQNFVSNIGGFLRTAFSFNGGIGSYAYRESSSGAPDTSTINRAGDFIMGTNSSNTYRYMDWFIVNEQARNKLLISHFVATLASGAGVAPTREEEVVKWDNTTQQITSMRSVDDVAGANRFAQGSLIKVWGHD